MDDVLRLGPEEVPHGRVFTHPDRTRGDWGALRTMARALRDSLGRVESETARPLMLELGQPGAPGHRVIVCDGARLRGTSTPSLVGFFAERRPGLDHTPLTRTDDALIEEFPAHPGILAYCSLELPDGNWGNLVVLTGPEAREHWRSSPTHAFAAGELAPRHYAAVRLHLGRFPGGLLAGADPVLDETRYYDFRDPTPWRATRRLEGYDPRQP